jgi:hypothetical protein
MPVGGLARADRSMLTRNSVEDCDPVTCNVAPFGARAHHAFARGLVDADLIVVLLNREKATGQFGRSPTRPLPTRFMRSPTRQSIFPASYRAGRGVAAKPRKWRQPLKNPSRERRRVDREPANRTFAMVAMSPPQMEFAKCFATAPAIRSEVFSRPTPTARLLAQWGSAPPA